MANRDRILKRYEDNRSKFREEPRVDKKRQKRSKRKETNKRRFLDED